MTTMVWHRNPQLPSQAAKYQKEALEVRTALAEEKALVNKERPEKLERMSAALSRADVDDYRVEVSVARLRELREENHFTPSLRLLFSSHTHQRGNA